MVTCKDGEKMVRLFRDLLDQFPFCWNYFASAREGLAGRLRQALAGADAASPSSKREVA
jgi:hypothetical protein